MILMAYESIVYKVKLGGIDMDIETFLEKFCPDYEARKENNSKEYNDIIETMKGDDDYDTIDKAQDMYHEFMDGVFEEALENFTEQVCKKQKDICADCASLFVYATNNLKDLEKIINSSPNPNLSDL